jgi:hypothetical protein
MTRYFSIFLWFLTVMVIEARSQDIYYISHKASKILPEDLKTETMLFLKFDSMGMPEKRPKGMTKAYYTGWKAHDAHVQKANTTLMDYLKKYPYKYKILSVNRLNEYKKQGAKYIFYLNSFDAFTLGASYRRDKEGFAPSATLGIIDLTSNENETGYFIANISSAQGYDYKLMMTKLFKVLDKQFGTSIE